MLFIVVKNKILLRNNWSLVSVNRGHCLHCLYSPLQMDLNHQMVGVYISRGLDGNEDGPVNPGLPGPWRGISSSLQGVWQACSPINCTCSSQHCVYKAPPAHIPGTGSTGTAAPAPSSTGGRGRWTREDILLKSLKMLVVQPPVAETLN